VSNFETKGLAITVYEASEAQKQQWLLPNSRWSKNQRTLDDFTLKEIRTERELAPDPSYTPNWWWLPSVLDRTTIEVSLTDEEAALIDALKATGEWGDDTPDEIVKGAAISWWTRKNGRY
jgi:hypothetical protein